jgi:hypothetical protein
MICAIFAPSGGLPLAAAALATSETSRKYCGPIAAGVITHSALAAAAALLLQVVLSTGATSAAWAGDDEIRRARSITWPGCVCCYCCCDYWCGRFLGYFVGRLGAGAAAADDPADHLTKNLKKPGQQTAMKY